MTECPIIPLGDKIIILPQEEGEQKYGNIIVPDAGQERPEIGTVLAVGPGRISTDGTLIPNRIEVGQTVMVPKFGAQVIVIENETYVVASENDVVGVPAGVYRPSGLFPIWPTRITLFTLDLCTIQPSS